LNNSPSPELKGIIAQMLKPLKGISLSMVIEGLSGNKIIPFDGQNNDNLILLNKLRTVAEQAAGSVNSTGIKRPRPNEVGNDIEPFVKNALKALGFSASTPKTTHGNHKSTGYPDIEFIDHVGRTHYLECKTFNIKNVSTTQRSFYLSPSDDFKVTKDAFHFLLSYEIDVFSTEGANKIYKCKSWKLINLEKLEVDVKYEFNSDNERLYSSDTILLEGKIY